MGWNRRRLVKTVLVVVILVYVFFPLLWLLKTSFEPGLGTGTFGRGTFSWLPLNASASNYKELVALSSLSFAGVAFGLYLKNSLIVASLTVLATMTIATFGAYGFSRFTFSGKRAVLVMMLVTQMISTVGLLIPLYRLLVRIHLLDTYFALVLTYTSFSVPFCTWFLKGFFDSIPTELEDAGRIDGCSRMGTLFRIVLPLALPGIVATTAFAFITAWNEFVFANTFITTTEMKTASVGLAALFGQRFVNWGFVAAGGFVGMAPVLVIFAFLQKYLIGGLTAGAVKG